MKKRCALQAYNLSVGYDGNSVANEISFSLNEGDYLCIVGENGAGKTTLMKTLLGLIPPISGRLELSDEIKEAGIGYLPQQSPIQKDFPATVMEVVLSGFLRKAGLRPFYNKTEKAAAKDALKKLGIAELERKCFASLSGGQQQRVLLARALCSTKKMILVDEPAAGLDPHAMAEMYSLLDGINKDGVTVVMITHDLSTSMKYATHVLFIHHDSHFMTRDEFVDSDFARTRFYGEECHD